MAFQTQLTLWNLQVIGAIRWVVRQRKIAYWLFTFLTALMKNAGYQPVPSYNPYWDENGLTFADPDGYRVVIQNETWDL